MVNFLFSGPNPSIGGSLCCQKDSNLNSDKCAKKKNSDKYLIKIGRTISHFFLNYKSVQIVDSDSKYIYFSAKV